MSILSENGIDAHRYFFIAVIVIFIIFLIYVYICEHKVSVEGNEIWENLFKKEGIDISYISHDDSMWYYRGNPTCVAYSGDFGGKCDSSENYCSKGNKYGDSNDQVQAIKKSIKNGGEHPMCPLIYQGTE